MINSSRRTLGRLTLPVLLCGLATFGAFPSGAEAQGNAKVVQLVNQLAGQSYEGRAVIFEPSQGTAGATQIELDLKNVFCRAGGRDPDIEQADQVGRAFHSLSITTVFEPRTRLHIFNTDCSTEKYQGDYALTAYFRNTNQTVADILDNPVTIEINFERDQDGDGVFEQDVVILRGRN